MKTRSIRITSPNIPWEDFRQTNGSRKVLRWFRNEAHSDYDLWLDDPKSDGTFVLRYRPKGMPFGAPGDAPVAVLTFGEPLGQEAVNKIEKAQRSIFTMGADFVIFEASPTHEEQYRKNTDLPRLAVDGLGRK